MRAPKLVEPYGCGRCGIPLPHGQQTGPGGLHGWERPSDAQILSRMKARRLARVVARVGALPVPAGPVVESDGITRVFVPVQVLREPEGEFYSVVHHDYRKGRDLPGLGGQR